MKKIRKPKFIGGTIRSDEEKDAGKVINKRTRTSQFYMMVLGSIVGAVGLVLFIIYFFSLNMVIGVPGILMIGAGIFVFWHYWKKKSDIYTDHIGGIREDSRANSLNIYPDKVEVAYDEKPKGFPWWWENLKKHFYVNIWDAEKKKLVPFVLPDQQYFDPNVFGQRVLGLPAHKRIFERKPKLLERLKPVFLLAAIGIVWLLLLTTTGG